MTRLITMAVLTSSIVGTSAVAATCADRAHVARQLETHHGETLESNVVGHDKTVLEIYTSGDADSWSILVFLPERGLSCLAATGNGRPALNRAVASL